jgi:hypothetical protein
MPHEFTRREEELEPQAGGSRSGRPPSKHTAAGVLDPPVPPRKPLSPIPDIHRSKLFRVLVALILIGLAIAAAAAIWKIF